MAPDELVLQNPYPVSIVCWSGLIITAILLFTKVTDLLLILPVLLDYAILSKYK